MVFLLSDGCGKYLGRHYIFILYKKNSNFSILIFTNFAKSFDRQFSSSFIIMQPPQLIFLTFRSIDDKIGEENKLLLPQANS